MGRPVKGEMLKNIKSLLSILLLLFLLAGCAAAKPVQPWHEAEEFIQALNRKDVDAMMAVSGTPFVFRNQKWETARDGSGFVLGSATDKVLPDRETLRKFFKELVDEVKVEDPKAAKNPPPKKEFLDNQLKGAPDPWLKLELHVFRRGFGDVEHVAIVGLEPGSHKVTGMYLN